MVEKGDPRVLSLSDTLAANVNALLARDYGEGKGRHSKFAKDHKAKGIVLRLIQDVTKKGTASLPSLEKLAKAFKVQPYQLLIKGLNAKEPQVAIERRQFEALKKMAKEITEEQP